MKNDKIYLVGFMAAGKTTLSVKLAEALGWQSKDVDTLVEARERLSVSEIFARHGEPYFRSAEHDILQLLLPLRHVVVSTGGGTFFYQKNRQIIMADGISIWLDISLEQVIARLSHDGRRPLATDQKELERLYKIRQESYRQANLHLKTDGTTPEQLTELAIRWLEKQKRKHEQ